MSGTSEEKALPASDKKLRDAREKGQVAKSTELVTASVTLCCFGYLIAQFPSMTTKYLAVIAATGDAAAQPFSVALHPVVSRLAVISAEVLVPLLLLVITASMVGGVFSTGGLVVSFHPLIPKLEVLNPVEGFKKMFSLRKLMDLLKNITKLITTGTVCVLLIRSSLQALVEQPSCGFTCAPGVMSGTLRPLLIMGSLFFVVIGLADIGLQRWLFLREQRMTKTEQKQETKNSEGDPQMKAAYKRVQKEASQSRLGLRQSTFAISGTGVFVALRYSSVDTRVPTVVARGEDEKATELLQEARIQQKPIHYDADIARIIFDQVRLGQPINKDLFTPVIAAMKLLDIF